MLDDDLGISDNYENNMKGCKYVARDLPEYTRQVGEAHENST